MLEHLAPERVFYYFEEISKIPRGSYHTKEISDYCVGVARQLGLSVTQDANNNVIIKKAGSAGNENAPALMLQGHLDMVCEKENGVVHDFEHDGLSLMITEDGYVTADGTTLGGDDGIAVAIGLAILEDTSLVHPPLEVVFTTEEEVGMDGALGLDTSTLSAKYLLNLDSENEGILTVSCAGGSTIELHMPYDSDSSYDLNSAYEQGRIYRLTVTGLIGGHSGVEINKGRADSNKLAAQVLTDILYDHADIRLIKIQGGLKHNAIPRTTEAVFAVSSIEAERVLRSCIDHYQKLYQQRYFNTDPDIQLMLETIPASDKDADASDANRVMTQDCTKRVLQALFFLPDGLQAMSQSIENLPETSLNLGVLRTDAEDIYIEVSNRSSNPASLKLLEDQLRLLGKIYGATCVMQSEYPGWEYLQESRLRDIMVAKYAELFGTPAKIEAVHAGLECGILVSKMPQLDIVSIGPDILDIHTPKERMSIVSVARTYEYIKAVMEELVKSHR